VDKGFAMEQYMPRSMHRQLMAAAVLTLTLGSCCSRKLLQFVMHSDPQDKAAPSSVSSQDATLQSGATFRLQPSFHRHRESEPNVKWGTLFGALGMGAAASMLQQKRRRTIRKATSAESATPVPAFEPLKLPTEAAQTLVDSTVDKMKASVQAVNDDVNSRVQAVKDDANSRIQAVNDGVNARVKAVTDTVEAVGNTGRKVVKVGEDLVESTKNLKNITSVPQEIGQKLVSPITQSAELGAGLTQELQGVAGTIQAQAGEATAIPAKVNDGFGRAVDGYQRKVADLIEMPFRTAEQVQSTAEAVMSVPGKVLAIPGKVKNNVDSAVDQVVAVSNAFTSIVQRFTDAANAIPDTVASVAEASGKAKASVDSAVDQAVVVSGAVARAAQNLGAAASNTAGAIGAAAGATVGAVGAIAETSGKAASFVGGVVSSLTPPPNQEEAPQTISPIAEERKPEEKKT